MSGMSGANNEFPPQSPLRPGPQTPHSISREAGGQARHSFQEDPQVRFPLSLQWKRPPIDLGSEEPSCTRWSVRAPLSPSESVACAGYQPTLWSPSLMP
jgi:hypothetical protein